MQIKKRILGPTISGLLPPPHFNLLVRVLVFERGIMTHDRRLKKPSVSSWPSRIQYVRQMIGKVSPDAERTCGYVSIQGATLTTQTSTEWVLQAQLGDMGGFSSLLVSQIPSLKNPLFHLDWVY